MQIIDWEEVSVVNNFYNMLILNYLYYGWRWLLI